MAISCRRAREGPAGKWRNLNLERGCVGYYAGKGFTMASDDEYPDDMDAHSDHDEETTEVLVKG